MMTDPIADLLTRIRNGISARRREVSMPASRLKREGFIESWELSPDGAQGKLTIRLKYGPDGERLINMIRRDSRPGRRIYTGAKQIERVLNGVGASIYSTPAGVLSDRECRARRVGGERLATIW